jgi:hypothetical protein
VRARSLSSSLRKQGPIATGLGFAKSIYHFAPR